MTNFIEYFKGEFSSGFENKYSENYLINSPKNQCTSSIHKKNFSNTINNNNSETKNKNIKKFLIESKSVSLSNVKKRKKIFDNYFFNDFNGLEILKKHNFINKTDKNLLFSQNNTNNLIKSNFLTETKRKTLIKSDFLIETDRKTNNTNTGNSTNRKTFFINEFSENINEKFEKINKNISNLMTHLKKIFFKLNQINLEIYQKTIKIFEKITICFEKIFMNNSLKYTLYAEFVQIKKLILEFNKYLENLPDEIFSSLDKLILLTIEKIESIDKNFFNSIEDDENEF